MSLLWALILLQLPRDWHLIKSKTPELIPAHSGGRVTRSRCGGGAGLVGRGKGVWPVSPGARVPLNRTGSLKRPTWTSASAPAG